MVMFPFLIKRNSSEQVTRAYAHEEFARLILRFYEELELNSESLLLEFGATVIDLEEK